MPGFGFVMNIGSLAEATYNLAPGNVLRRATDNEAYNVEGLPVQGHGAFPGRGKASIKGNGV